MPSPSTPARCVALAAVLGGGCIDYTVDDPDEVYEEPLRVEEVFHQAPSPRLDVLWVVDHTGSMADEQERLAEAFASFVDVLETYRIAYQLGVTTTAGTGADAGVLRGTPWIVTPQVEDPAAAFGAAVRVGTEGLPPSCGLGAAWLALTDPLRTEENRGFRRPGAVLHVVVVSDDDDESETLLGDDPASAFLDFLDAEETAFGGPVTFSAIAGDLPDGCTADGGRAQAATRYHEVATARGGVFGSICTADFSGLLASMAASAVVFPDTFPLQAEPEPASVRVTLDGTRQDDGWGVAEAVPAVVFDEPPPPDAEIRVSYVVREGGT